MKNCKYFLLIYFLISCSASKEKIIQENLLNDTIFMIQEKKSTHINNEKNLYVLDELHILLLNDDNKSDDEIEQCLNRIKNLKLKDEKIDQLISKIEDRLFGMRYGSTSNSIEKIEEKEEENKNGFKIKNLFIDGEIKIDYGRLNYLLEDTMEVGKNYVVEISISKNLSKKESIIKVKTFIGKEKNVKDTIIRITKDMEIKLIDPTGECFKINIISDEVQIIEDKEVTIWRWNVTPLKDGENDLNVIVDVIFGSSHKSYIVYEDKIHVFMKNKCWVKSRNFFFENLEIIIGSVLVPLIGWIFTVYILPLFKKKNKKL